MEENEKSFGKDLENILKKTIDINKEYLKKGTDLVQEFRKSDNKIATLKAPDTNSIMGALTSFAELNLTHYKNMLDLGLEFSRRTFSNEEDAEIIEETEGDTTTENLEPSFILSAEVQQGGSATLQFILDNVKNEDVHCEMRNLEFTDESGLSNSALFSTIFAPQSFDLKKEASQTVNITVGVNDRVKEGNYQSKVQVIGFEPIYFLVKITVLKK